MAAAAALAPITWGTTYLVTQELLPPGRPLFSAVLRALPIGLVLVALFRRLPEGRWRYRVPILGALNFSAVFALVFVAAYRLPGGVAATIGAAQPLVVSGLAWAILGERPSARTVGAGFLGVLGVALLVLTPAARLDPLGILAALAVTVAFAAGTVLTRWWGRPAPLLLFTGWQLVAGGLLLLPLALAVEGVPSALTLRNGAGYAYLGLVNTGLAYVVWFRGLDRMSVSALTFLLLLNPIVAVVAGAVVRSEHLTLLQLVGAAAVAVAVALGQAPVKRLSTPSGAAAPRAAERRRVRTLSTPGVPQGA